MERRRRVSSGSRAFLCPEWKGVMERGLKEGLTERGSKIRGDEITSIQ